MSDQTEFRFGEGGRETMQNVIAAAIHDFVDAPKRPEVDDILREVEGMVGSMPAIQRAAIVLIVRGLEVAPLAMGYKKQFSNLERDDQVKVLESFEKSSNYLQRGVIMILKSFVLINYFSTPEMDEALGYDHQCLLPGGHV